MRTDQQSLESIYENILEENWKNKLMGGAATVGLGLAGLHGLGSHIVNKDNAIKNHVDPSGAKIENIELSDAFQNTGKLTQLIQQYYKTIGKDVKVQVQGENILLTFNTGTKTLPIKSLKVAVDTSKSNGDTQKLSGFLAQRL
jgi:hypothetical protein